MHSFPSVVICFFIKLYGEFLYILVGYNYRGVYMRFICVIVDQSCILSAIFIMLNILGNNNDTSKRQSIYWPANVLSRRVWFNICTACTRITYTSTSEQSNCGGLFLRGLFKRNIMRPCVICYRLCQIKSYCVLLKN